ncbi:MAG: DeoR/GlpR family DNA-binding transcription regulator [Megasphaera massiliensis]|jgi:DeoR/GlpR family transcriptional regulator of sugar metabolism|uniref:DeoR/GlpR family DNA-binding transcription regulator n=1 Tax=Megasphaera massiliensis TaxID=1232428 RepID=UPI002A74A770|nr:DeoR/GlpR family DNA-binding transcription regulator [Megasphaera massiliensis]MDY2965288.1 DeoR/GlpR family DNA-binding transcription regulator [Megasphaera massiliensis]
MLGLERRQKIMEKIRIDRKVYVSELAKLFKVTEETIRRDLEKLESQELLSRSYGGAVITESTSDELSYTRRSSINNESKLLIADKAASLIHDGDTIMMDSSTTCQALLQRLQNQRNITVVTNSIRLMNDFIGCGFKMICTGGTMRDSSCALTDSIACETLTRYYVDFAFISCKSIDLNKGIMESNESESRVKSIMMQQARNTILLVDHSKFDKTAFVKCDDFERIDTLVTDVPPSKEWQEFLADKQINLIV